MPALNSDVATSLETNCVSLSCFVHRALWCFQRVTGNFLEHLFSSFLPKVHTRFCLWPKWSIVSMFVSTRLFINAYARSRHVLLWRLGSRVLFHLYRFVLCCCIGSCTSLLFVLFRSIFQDKEEKHMRYVSATVLLSLLLLRVGFFSFMMMTGLVG